MDYATITINVEAPEADINKNEMALSDQLYEAIDALEKWLERKAVGTPFSFIVKD
jgi:hypothetical protein